MRKLTIALVTLTGLLGGIAGCGDSSNPGTNFNASGAGGTVGSAGTAGTNAAGESSAGANTVAGDTNTAGSDSTVVGGGGGADSGGSGGATAGSGGAVAGAPAGGAAPAPCDNVPNKPLPYAISADFVVPHVLTEGSASSWQVIANPDCDATTFPAFPSAGGSGGTGGDSGGTGGAAAGVGGAAAGTGGASGGTGGTSAGAGGESGGTGGAAAGTGGASGGVSGGGAGGATAGTGGTAGISGAGGSAAQAPACYEFAYNPDACVAAGGTCWAGMIFQPTDAMGPAIKGVCIEQGATVIEFWARSSRDAARIKFGSIRPGVDTTEYWLNITTTWAKYTIAIPTAESYDTSSTDAAGGVWNGFSVVTEPGDHAGGSYILVKDVVWKKQ